MFYTYFTTCIVGSERIKEAAFTIQFDKHLFILQRSAQLLHGTCLPSRVPSPQTARVSTCHIAGQRVKQLVGGISRHVLTLTLHVSCSCGLKTLHRRSRNKQSISFRLCVVLSCRRKSCAHPILFYPRCESPLSNVSILYKLLPISHSVAVS